MGGGNDPRLAAALAGLGGAPPSPGRLYVVAVPRFGPELTSLRAAVLLAGADVLRVPPELPADVLAGLGDARREPGGLASFDPKTLDVDEQVVVQLVATAVQTSPAVMDAVASLLERGTRVELVASVGEVDAALVAGGIGPGVSRAPADGRLDIAVVAADRAELKEWRAALTRRGYLDHTPVVVVERAGTPGQRAAAMTVKDLTDLAVTGPLLIVVGDDVAGPAPWRSDLPLAGHTVLNPRAKHQAAELSAKLRSLGAAVVEAPLLSLEPGDEDAVDAAVRALADGAVGLLGLTSRNGVRALAAGVERCGLDARALAGAGRVACVGPGTAAALWDLLHVRADVIGQEQHGAGLAATVGEPDGHAAALLLRGERANDDLPEGLRAAGWDVTDVIAYRTRTLELAPPVLAMLAAGSITMVPVLSSSMAAALVTQGRGRGVTAPLVSIGPSTTATLHQYGVAPSAEADPHDLEGLVAALCRVARSSM